MQVEHGTHCACLGTVAEQLFAKLGYLIVRAVTQELVTQRDVVEDAVVHVRHPRVVAVPGQVGDVGRLVASQPGAGHLVGAALLQVEVAAHVVIAADA